MEENIIFGLEHYEKDFLLFQKELPKLRKNEPDRFVAFKEGRAISTGMTVEEVKKDLESKGIEPSGTVIEFVSKEEIKVIV